VTASQFRAAYLQARTSLSHLRSRALALSLEITCAAQALPRGSSSGASYTADFYVSEFAVAGRLLIAWLVLSMAC